MCALLRLVNDLHLAAMLRWFEMEKGYTALALKWWHPRAL